MGGVANMNSLTADELLEMLCHQWANTKDIMKIGSVGEVRARRVKNIITKALEDDGYVLPRYLVPMEEVAKYFNINIDYLKKVTNEKEIKNGK